MPASPRPRCPFLSECARRIDEGANRFGRSLAGLDADQATWKPGAKRWSVAECVEHLTVTHASYDEVMTPAIAAARDEGLIGEAPYGKGTVIGRFLLASLDPRRKPKRMKAPKTFQPAPAAELDWDEVRRGFVAGNERLLELMAEADGLDLGRITIGSPAFKLAKLTVAQAFEVLSVHELRHLAQAERVTEAEGFPPGR